MAKKTLSLNSSEWMTIYFALETAMCARQAVASKCVVASESGVESVYTKQEWLELAKKAKQEEADFRELKGKILQLLYPSKS